MSEIWGWQNVRSHPKDFKKSLYSGPGNITEYLKRVVVNKLEMLGINPDQWVSNLFTKEEKRKRERTRKRSTPNIIEHAIDNTEPAENGNDISE